MALYLRESANNKFKFTALFVAVFTLVIQPLYGLVAGQVANAVSANVDTVVFAPATATVKAGEEKTFTLKFRHGNTNEALDSPATVQLSTTSATGEFAEGTSATNPWSHTASYSTNAAASKTFRYKDSSAGAFTISAHVSGGGLTAPLDASAAVTVRPSTPPPAACTYDFQAQKMWEVTWGYDFAHRNGGAPKFTMQSNGGLVSLNGEPVPSYMTSTWHWLYVTDKGNANAPLHYDYGFADGTIRTADVSWNTQANGCQTPEIVWGTTIDTSSTVFVNDPKYVRTNNASDLAAQIVTPDTTTNVRFYLDGNKAVTYPGKNVGGAGATTSWWRLYTPLTAGEHVVSAQIEIGGTWYDVADTGSVYALSDPSADYVTPAADGTSVIRPHDNPAQVRISDTDNHFSDVIFTVDGAKYSVKRSDCDVRQAGKYVICQAAKSATWPAAGLSEGAHIIESVVAYNDARGNARLPARAFTVDSTPPEVKSVVVTSPATSVYGRQVTVAVHAADTVGLKTATLYAVQKDGSCNPNGAKVLSVTNEISGQDATTSFVLDTAQLNGDYCFFAYAKDVATNSNNPNTANAKFEATFDNTAPTISVVGGFTGNKDQKIFSNVSFLLFDEYKVDKFAINGHMQDRADDKWYNANFQNIKPYLVEGQNTLVVYDVAGNDSTYEFTYDASAPMVTISNPENGRSYNNTIDVVASITDANLSHYYLSIFKNGTRILAKQVNIAEFSDKIVASLSDEGSYTVKIEARDKAGNKAGSPTQDGLSVKTVSFTIDRTAPVFTATSAERNPDGTYTITGTTENGLTPSVMLNDQPVTSVTVNGTEWTATTSVLPAGDYVVKVSGEDSAGNISQPTEASIYKFTYTPEPTDTTGGGSTAPETPGGGTNNGQNGTQPGNSGNNSGGANTGNAGPNNATSQSIQRTAASAPLTLSSPSLARNLALAAGIFGPTVTSTSVAQPTEDQEVKAAETKQPNDSKKEVKGLETIADAANDIPAANWNIFSLAWYWWLLILAALVVLWLIIAAAIRRAKAGASA